MSAKELTEANCYPTHSCSKLLPIDVVFIWFSDRMLFTLTTLKIGEWRLVQLKIEHWSKNAFCARMTFSQLLLVIDVLSGSSYLSNPAQRKQNTLVYSTRVSQGSVATRFGCGGIFNESFIANFPESVSVKEFGQYVQN